MRVVVTGAAGLLGWHASAHLTAMNAAARFRGACAPVHLVGLGRETLNDPSRLAAALEGADAVLHFAGVHRGTDSEVEAGNPAIATCLAQGIAVAGGRPHIVYANSVHAGRNTPYGRSKSRAGEILADIGCEVTDLVLPHIFGESARPGYNNVTATLIDHLHRGVSPLLTPGGKVELLHAGEAVDAAIDAALGNWTGRIAPKGLPLRVSDLWEKLSSFHRIYAENTFPDLRDPFDLALFNCYRGGGTGAVGRVLRLNGDHRGALFEAVKGSGGQVFVSWTKPGVTRGNHFHLSKAERFVVLQGQARIRLRRVLGDTVQSIDVSGETPTAVDIPTLHTHSIENTGTGPLLTLFWAHEVFDPVVPDTYSDPLMRGADEAHEQAQGHDHPWNAPGDHPPLARHGAA